MMPSVLIFTIIVVVVAFLLTWAVDLIFVGPGRATNIIKLVIVLIAAFAIARRAGFI